MQELSTSPQPAKPVPVSWIERIFVRLGSYYGSKFADLWNGFDVAQVKLDWAEALATYTPDEIGRGIAECLRHDWPPTLPEFLKRCRPALDPEAAYWEACKVMPLRHSTSEHVRAAAKFSHPAIFWAACEFGDIGQTSYDRIKTRWKMALDEAYRRCYEVGGKFATVPEPAPLLQHEKPAITEEQRKGYIDRLKREIGGTANTVTGAELTEEQRQQRLQRIDQAIEAQEAKTEGESP